jgi:hypothetical protein
MHMSLTLLLLTSSPLDHYASQQVSPKMFITTYMTTHKSQPSKSQSENDACYLQHEIQYNTDIHELLSLNWGVKLVACSWCPLPEITERPTPSPILQDHKRRNDALRMDAACKSLLGRAAPNGRNATCGRWIN